MAMLCWVNFKVLSWLNWMGLANGRSGCRPWESRAKIVQFNTGGIATMAIMLTKKAEDKVKEILTEQPEPYAGLRIQVIGGGCSGFQYRMGFDKNFNDQNDAIFEFDGLKVFIDKASLLYMDGAEVDYIEGLHGAGFKFNNPNVTGSCGCGSSFSV